MTMIKRMAEILTMCEGMSDETGTAGSLARTILRIAEGKEDAQGPVYLDNTQEGSYLQRELLNKGYTPSEAWRRVETVKEYIQAVRDTPSISVDYYQQMAGTLSWVQTAEMEQATSPAYMVMALAGEVGELVAPIKKAWRDSGDPHVELSDAQLAEVIDEAGDVLWYLVRLMDVLNVKMEDVARKHLEKLADRTLNGKTKK